MSASQNPLTLEPFTMHVNTQDLPTPERALAIGAHPDDTEFGCGATLAKWAADGCVVNVLVCTDGSKGTWDADTDMSMLIRTRQEEQIAATRALGGTGEVVFLGYTDGELRSDLDARAGVAYWIRELRPNVVLGHDPWKRYRLHPDHRHAGLLACEGIVAARDPKFFPEQRVPHFRPDRLLLFEADEPDHAEDVSGHVASKLLALRQHESQFESTMIKGKGGSMVDFERRVEAKVREAGAAAGLTHAEVFKLIDDL
jgi:LmbE family N-acetylglucosaminyl deacetylase